MLSESELTYANSHHFLQPPGNSMRIHLPFGRSLGLSSSTLSNTLSDEDEQDLPGGRKYGSDTEAAQRHRRT